MCAPRSVGAIDPVGMTKASTTNARKMNARMKATRIDSIVSLTLPSFCDDEDFFPPADDCAFGCCDGVGGCGGLPGEEKSNCVMQRQMLFDPGTAVKRAIRGEACEG